jgi:hypothetical protein
VDSLSITQKFDSFKRPYILVNKKKYLLDKFNKLDDKSNIYLLVFDDSLTLVERLILVDIFISYKIYFKNNFEFNLGDCFDEIISLKKDLYYLIDKDELFFSNMLQEIKEILDNKKFKTNFNLNFYKLDLFIYLNSIINSLYYTNYDYTNYGYIQDDFFFFYGMLHRNIVLLNIQTNIEVLNLFDLNKNLKKNIIKVIMSIDKSIIKKKITIKDNKSIKSNLFLKLNTSVILDYKTRFFINFSKIKFKNNDKFFIGASYLTFCKFIKKSNSQDFINSINTSAIVKLSKQELIIDFKDWEFIKNKIISIILEKYKIKLNAFFEVVDVLEQLYFEKTKYNILIKDKKTNIHYETLNFKVEEINKEIQRLYYVIIAEKAKYLTYPIYIPYYYDFRGRIYPKSLIGFTYLKFIRSLFKFKVDTTLNLKDKLDNSIYFKKVMGLNIIIDNIFLLKICNDYQKFLTITHLLELGKLFKGEIISEDGITLQEFINLGTKYFYTKNFIKLDISDFLYANSICKNLELFLNTNRFDDIIIMRDSTASFLQHWGLKLKIKELHLNKLNIDGYIYYDIYTQIISFFLLNNPEFNNLNYKPILNRKILKNIIMVVNYNARKQTCFNNLKNNLNENNIKFNELGLKIFCYKLYDFLNNDLFEYLFVYSKLDFLKKINNKLSCIDNSEIDLNYFKFEDIKEDIKFKNNR